MTPERSQEVLDPVVDRVRAARARIAQRCHYDVDEMATYLRDLEAQHRDRLCTPEMIRAENEAETASR